MSNRSEMAQLMARLGGRIFAAKPGEKTPLYGWSWYSHSYTDPEDIAGMFEDHPNANFGVWPGEKLVVIDLDMSDGKNGIGIFNSICAENGLGSFLDLPTLMVQSARGGIHLYFRAPFPCGLANDFPHGIDVRGTNGYVIGPGSELRNDDGELIGTYEVVDPDAEIMDLPDWLAAYMHPPGRRDPKYNEPLVKWDLPENIDHARHWLEDREPAVEGQHGDQWTIETVFYLRDFGLSEKACYAVLNEGWNQRCEPPWCKGELETKIGNAFAYPQNRPGCKSPVYRVHRINEVHSLMSEKWAAQVEEINAGRNPKPQPSFQRSDRGKLCQNYANALEAVEHLDVSPEYCEFTRRAVIGLSDGRRVPLDETALRLIRREILNVWGLELSKENVFEALEAVALESTFHPVRAYFENLEWDGTKRLDSWLTDYFHVERGEYTRAVGRKWLIGGAARIYRPGCKFDTMLVFVGGQGASKSKALRVLAIRDTWFTDSLPENLAPDNKDAVLGLQGKLICEFSEVASTRRGQRDTVKGFISRQVDEARPPYGRAVNEYPRQCILAGSTNEASFLEDPTGARRYWPVEIPNGHQIDVDGLREVVPQLWAEAVAAYKSGEAVELPEDLWPVAAQHQEHHRSTDPWEDRLRDYVDATGSGVHPTEPLDRVHTSTLLSSALGIETKHQTANNGKRLRPIMENRLGWIYKASLKVDGVVRGGYVRYEPGFEPIQDATE